VSNILKEEYMTNVGKNLIFQSTDVKVIPEVMLMIHKSRVKGVDLEEMEAFIYRNLSKSDTRLWIAFDGTKITGFLLAYLVYPYSKPEVFIAWAYSDPWAKDVAPQLMDITERWARSLKITKICTMVRKDLSAYQKKYGFVLDSYNVYKNINLEVKK
jgi:hypothetical protein